MRERPILFSGPMVRALLDGRKTQTRRVCKPAQAYNLSHVVEVPDPQERGQVYNGSCFGDEDGEVNFASPYRVGDRLWVRETFCRIDGQTQPWIETDYRATYETGDRLGDLMGIRKKWTPSIFMPRHASRILLEITKARVERLNDCSRADARAEGCDHDDPCDHKRRTCAEICCAGPDYRIGFRKLWESINGVGSWDANPWVWAVDFRRVS